MKTLNVSLDTRSYPIYIGNGLLGTPELLTRHIKGRQVLVVTNETVAPLYLDKVLDCLQGFQSDSIVLPDGEEFKTLDTTNQIYTRLLEKHFNRDVTLIALGGGVIGDITGFAAASYQRGVAFIQVPTTLLAQVDSSVGGKTGVNHPLGKNMIGAFHQPNCVIADTATLDSLDDRQLSAGLAEIIKYGLIREPDFFTWLQANMDKLVARDKPALIESIERSCRCKAEVVAADETEQGIRAILNLGHTFGHAIETAAGYGNWLHGEAVATGMLMAADLSHRLGWLGDSDVATISTALQAAHLPVSAPAAISNQQYLDLMAVDKKVIDGRIRLVLLKAIGEAVITDDFDPALLAQTLDAYRTEVT